MQRLTDLMGDAVYDRDGDELLSKGLYLDMGPWQYHLFRMEAIPQADSTVTTATTDQSQRSAE
jgi:hypothetical protein